MKKKVLAVLPLRLESARIPQKMLKKIGKYTLCEHSVGRVLATFQGSEDVEVVAAVDSPNVKALLQKTFPKLNVIMTDPELPSGTDRVLAASQEYVGSRSLSSLSGILNIQGDMPFVGSKGLLQIAGLFLNNPSNILLRAPVVTLSEPFGRESRALKISEKKIYEAYLGPSAVKVMVDREGFAIYFSRFPIPYSRLSLKKPLTKAGKTIPLSTEADLHLGVYGFTPKALVDFCSQSPTPIELLEGLEQLRAMWLGQKILVLRTEYEKGASYRGVDMKEDLKWAQENYKKYNALHVSQ